MKDLNSVDSVSKSQHLDKFDIREYLLKLIKAWPIGVLSIVICVGLAIAYLLYATPQFHITSKILIQDDNKTGGQAGAAMMDLTSILGGKSSVDNEVEVLNTRYLMDRLVRDKQLNITWFEKEGIKKRELNVDPYQVRVYSLSDTIVGTYFTFTLLDVESFKLEYEDPITEEEKELSLKFNKPFDLPGFGRFSIDGIGKPDSKANISNGLGLIITSIDSRVEALRAALTINTTNKLASTIDVQFDYPVPSKGERILNGYIDEYIQQDIRDKSRIADSTIKFIDERILLVNQELNGIEGNIQTFMQGRGLANISEQAKLLLESNTDYIKQLSEIENKIQVMNAVEELLNEPGNKRLVAGSVLADDQTFNSLLSSYNNLNLERERLLLSYTPDNPFVTNMDQRITSVKENILTYIRSTRSNLEVSKRELERNTGKIRGNIRDVPAQERQFLDLSRQQQLKQELYLYLLQKREETAVANTSNIAGIRVIDPPKAEYKPFSPKKPIIALGAFLFALIIPVCYVYGLDLLNTKVQNRKDVEKRTQLPIIGEFTHNPTEADLIEFKSSRSALAEQFRALRTNLQFMLPRPTDKVILVTSGMPGEGKSFTSLNLANVYAYSGKKVLLLEFDLRKPKLSKTYTGLSNVGISNYIVDQSLSLNDMINPVGDTGNLYFGACGPIPPNPAELIMSERVAQMMQEARERFDVIIIDAPPLGAVTDGQLLSTYADVTLHLVRANYTPHELVGLPEDMRREEKIKNMAIILNDVSENAGGYYGYNYGYYHAEEAKKRWWRFGRK